MREIELVVAQQVETVKRVCRVVEYRVHVSTTCTEISCFTGWRYNNKLDQMEIWGSWGSSKDVVRNASKHLVKTQEQPTCLTKFYPFNIHMCKYLNESAKIILGKY